MINLHTHTCRCKHATGDIGDYVQSALQCGLDSLGFSDHTPLPDNRWISVRMPMDEIDNYFSAIEDAKRKYSDIINIYKSLECDWDSCYKDFFFGIKEKYACDYLIGAVHWYPYKGDWYSAFEITDNAQLSAYVKHYIEALSSGLFCIMAHPDIFGCAYVWDENAESAAEEIVKAAYEAGVFLEINANGFRKGKITDDAGVERYRYPLPEFWKIYSRISTRAVVCNSDAHHPDEVIANIQDCTLLASKYNLNIVESFPCSQ